MRGYLDNSEHLWEQMISEDDWVSAVEDMKNDDEVPVANGKLISIIQPCN